MKILLNGYWDEYQKKIIYTQFLPSIIFHTSMVYFMVVFLRDEIRKDIYFEEFYPPALGFVCVLLWN